MIMLDELHEHLMEYCTSKDDVNLSERKTLYFSDLAYDLRHIEYTLCYPKLCTFGDYDNSCHIERANYRYLEKWCEEKNLFGVVAWRVSGGYGSATIAFLNAWPESQDENAKEFIELVNTLNDYPAFDDELCSEVSFELYYAAIDDILSDIDSDIREALDDDSDKIRELFEQFNNEQPEPHIIESGGLVYIPNFDDTQNKMRKSLNLGD